MPLICYFSKTVSLSLTKGTWKLLGAADLIPGAPALSLSAVSTSALAKSREGGSDGKMLLRVNKSLEHHFENQKNMVGAQKPQAEILPESVALWGTLTYRV